METSVTISGYQIAAVLLGLAALFSFINERFLKLPSTIGLFLLALTLAMLVGVCQAASSVYIHEIICGVIESLNFGDVLMQGMLCFLLFAGALHVPINLLEEEKWQILALAVLSTLLSTVLIGFGLWGVLNLIGIEFPLLYALIFGALISPTDPIAAMAILTKAGLPKRLEVLFSGESLFNDGVGVVLFILLTGVAISAGDSIAEKAFDLVLMEVGGGVLAGVLLGLLAHVMVKDIKDVSSRVLITVAVVSAGYAACMALDISGLIAMVITGLIFGNVTLARTASQKERHDIDVFWTMIDNLLNAVLFVMIGLQLIAIPFQMNGLLVGLIAILLSLAGRYISIFVTTALFKMERCFSTTHYNIVNLLTWGGLRGGLSIALAFSLPEGPEKTLIVNMTFAVAAFSILVQGLTVGRLYNKMQTETTFRKV